MHKSQICLYNGYYKYIITVVPSIPSRVQSTIAQAMMMTRSKQLGLILSSSAMYRTPAPSTSIKQMLFM